MGLIQSIKQKKYIIQISDMYQDLDGMFHKSCKFCRKDFGNSDQVFDFVCHLEDEHPDALPIEKIDKYKKLCLKLMN